MKTQTEELQDMEPLEDFKKQKKWNIKKVI